MVDAVVLTLTLLMLSLSNLFGPCMLLRYFYYLILAFPLMVFLLAKPIQYRAETQD